MIVLLDTSTSLCQLTLVDGEHEARYEWQADRQLAKGLLRWLEDRLADEGKVWRDVTAIGAFVGPGSFTGLRIGLTVLNTLADSLEISIVGCRGDNWQADAKMRLSAGENDRIALPFYGAEANITIPRK